MSGDFVGDKFFMWRVDSFDATSLTVPNDVPKIGRCQLSGLAQTVLDEVQGPSFAGRFPQDGSTHLGRGDETTNCKDFHSPMMPLGFKIQSAPFRLSGPFLEFTVAERGASRGCERFVCKGYATCYYTPNHYHT